MSAKNRGKEKEVSHCTERKTPGKEKKKCNILCTVVHGVL